MEFPLLNSLDDAVKFFGGEEKLLAYIEQRKTMTHIFLLEEHIAYEGNSIMFVGSSFEKCVEYFNTQLEQDNIELHSSYNYTIVRQEIDSNHHDQLRVYNEKTKEWEVPEWYKNEENQNSE